MRARSVVPKAALAALILAAPAQAQTWTLEKHPKELRLKRASKAPVVYLGNNKMSPEIILSCDLTTKRLSAFVGARIKVEDAMTYRFDVEPPVESGTGLKNAEPLTDAKGYLDGYKIKVPAAQTKDFVKGLLSHRRMWLRFSFGRYLETDFDLAGLDPFSSKVGSWTVSESTSKADDGPLVVLIAYADPGNATLVIRCQEKQVDAYVKSAVFDYDQKTRQATLSLSIDGAAAQDVTGSVATSGTAVFIPEPRAFIQSLVGHKTLRALFHLYQMKALQGGTIPIADLAKALPPFDRACPASQP